MVFNEEDVNVSELLYGLIKEFEPITIEKEIEITANFSEDAKNIYRQRQNQSSVFPILSKNAIHSVFYKNRVKIVIGMKVNTRDIEFFVEDNGSGISDDDQKDLFKKFYQVDTSSKRKKGGSGLGLAICKGIVEGLGGKIWVKSEENIKTTFFFKIPRK